jgi:DnaJ-class molecular chaperone
MSTKNYYEILGVSSNATQQEIESAYRKIVLENHPDLHPGDKEKEERLKLANEAYAVLKDPEKRKAYDESLRSGGTSRTASPASRMRSSPRGGAASDPLSQIFQRMQQPAASTSATPSGTAATEYELKLTDEEARHGTVKILKVNGRPVKIRIPPGVKDGAAVPLIVRIRITRSG